MAFFKHDFHYDEDEHRHELERLRQQQNIQKEWLDQQIAEKARLNEEARRDGKITREDYEQFEERRIARFKYNLIQRIIQNWSSVTSFDWAEANQLAQEDPKFKAALDAAKEDHERKERNKQLLQEERQRNQMAFMEKGKGNVKQRRADLGFDPSDPYSKLLAGVQADAAAAAAAALLHPRLSPPKQYQNESLSANLQLQEYNNDAGDNPVLSRVTRLPQLKGLAAQTEDVGVSTQAVQQQQQRRMDNISVVPTAGEGNCSYSAPGPVSAPQPPYQPVYYPIPPPQPTQIITPSQPSNVSELKALLELLQDQRQSVLHDSANVQIEKMFSNFQAKLDEVILTNEKNIETAVYEGVRRELEGKLAELRSLMEVIERQKLESRQKKRSSSQLGCASSAANVDAETSMSNHRPSVSVKMTLSPSSLQLKREPDDGRDYAQLSFNDPIEKILKELQKRNAERIETLRAEKASRDREKASRDREKARSTDIDQPKAPHKEKEHGPNERNADVYANLVVLLDQLNAIEAGSPGHNTHTGQNSLLSATDFISKVLSDMKDSAK